LSTPSEEIFLKIFGFFPVVRIHQPTDRPTGGEHLVRDRHVFFHVGAGFLNLCGVHIAVEVVTGGEVPHLVQDANGNISEAPGKRATAHKVLAESLVSFGAGVDRGDGHPHGVGFGNNRPIVTLACDHRADAGDQLNEVTDRSQFSHGVAPSFPPLLYQIQDRLSSTFFMQCDCIIMQTLPKSKCRSSRPATTGSKEKGLGLLPIHHLAGVEVHVLVVDHEAFQRVVVRTDQPGEPTDVLDRGHAVQAVEVHPTFGVNRGNHGLVAHQFHGAVFVVVDLSGGLFVSCEFLACHCLSLLSLDGYIIAGLLDPVKRFWKIS